MVPDPFECRKAPVSRTPPSSEFTANKTKQKQNRSQQHLKMAKNGWPERLDIRYITNAPACRSAAHEILSHNRRHQYSIWGLDVEWKPPHGSIALIQIGRDNLVYLFHVSLYQMSRELITVLRNPWIFFVGVHIQPDIIRLHRSFPQLHDGVQGAIEIRRILKEYLAELTTTEEANTATTTTSLSLANLCHCYLNKELEKPVGIRCGDWNKPLNSGQRRYAALDAIASFELGISLLSCLSPFRSHLHLLKPNSLLHPSLPP